MELLIKIDRNDLGLWPKQIKSLLNKLGLTNSKKLLGLNKDDRIIVNLDFDKEETNELSLALIWMFLNSHVGLPCQKFIKYRGSSQKYFDERHFFDSLTGNKSSFFNPSSIPINYESFQPVRPTKEKTQNDQITQIFKVVTKDIIDNKDRFQTELRTQMTECVQNAFDHSFSTPGRLAGSVCSVKNNGFVDFCVVDTGQGIKKSFLNNKNLRKGYSSLEEKDVISKATDKGISCNPSGNRNPDYDYGNGGIGLYYLREFIRLHPESKLVIISGSGYYFIDYLRETPKLATINNPWPGTVVYFRTRLKQSRSDDYTKIVDAFIEEFDNTATL